jgi:hypothetical protein
MDNKFYNTQKEKYSQKGGQSANNTSNVGKAADDGMANENVWLNAKI